MDTAIQKTFFDDGNKYFWGDLTDVSTQRSIGYQQGRGLSVLAVRTTLGIRICRAVFYSLSPNIA